jgi:non-ribosomal peptide synthetase component E (peptide arylation enzyme)
VKFNPVEVEEVLNRHPAIENCTIIPLADIQLGERGCLCVKLNDHHDLTLGDVKTTLSKFGMAKYKWPGSLIILKELPMTPRVLPVKC